MKPATKGQNSVKEDVRKLVQENYIQGSLSVRDSVSDIKIIAEFERRVVSMSVKIQPPLDKGTVARISWIGRQLEICQKKGPEVFSKLSKDLLVEADVKYARENIKVRLSEFAELVEATQGKEIQAFRITLVSSFGAGFASQKKFIQLIENAVLDFYEGVVQHMTNWNRPAPRLSK